jgi:hypothetical protein
MLSSIDWSGWLFAATALLALFTGGLALGTFRSVRDSGRLAASAEADMSQRVQPYLVPQRVKLMSDSTPIRFVVSGVTTLEPPPRIDSGQCWHEDFTGWVAVRLQNVGLGSAVIVNPAEDITISARGVGLLNGSSTDLAIGVGAECFLAFAGQANSPAASFNLRSLVDQPEEFTVAVRYFDMRQEQGFQTTVVYTGARPEPEVKAFHVSRLGDDHEQSNEGGRQRLRGILGKRTNHPSKAKTVIVIAESST